MVKIDSALRRPDECSQSWAVSKDILERRGTADHKNISSSIFEETGGVVRKRSKDHWREVLCTKPGTPSHVEQSLKFEAGDRVLRIIACWKRHFEEGKHSRPSLIALESLFSSLKQKVIWYERGERIQPSQGFINDTKQ